MQHSNPEFRNFIQNLLRSSDLEEKYIELITDESGMKEFTKSFTTKGFDEDNNYEYYEILGDSTSNKVVVWYFNRRFPQFKTMKGTGSMGPTAIMARLKIVGVSKATYSGYARQLGFFQFIRSTPDEQKETLKLLEDTFEAFIGCTESLIDERIQEHCGYSVIYKFMSKVMDQTPITLTREFLYDAKSLVNEEVNRFNKRLKIKYDFTQNDIVDPSNYNRKYGITLIITFDGREVYRSRQPAYAAKKITGEEMVAKQALNDKIFDRLYNQFMRN